MAMVGGWKKNFLRRKQQADQLIGRAEKSEVISNELQELEKRAEIIKSVCKATRPKLETYTRASDGEFEKRLKKMPEHALSQSMLESAAFLGMDSLLGQVFQICGGASETLARDHVHMLVEIDNNICKPLQEIENDVKNIAQNKKHLKELTLDMDAAKTRYQSAVRQTQSTANAKLETMRDEVDEASQKVDQARDLFITDLYSFTSKEPEHSKLLLHFAEIQMQYHEKALAKLREIVPQLQEHVGSTSLGKAYGVPLEEHLQRTNREIAYVLEECIPALYTLGIEEEGLFRIAGGAAKVKKLKAALDCGCVDLSENGEYGRDVHSIAGALKQYLRELPQPLMTYELYDEWMSAAMLPQDQRLQQFWMLLQRLPEGNFNNLRYLIKFLAKLSEHQDVNRMSPSNIAIVIGPNLIWPPGEGGPSVLTTGTQSAIVEALIFHAEYFFPGDVDFHKTGRGRGVESVMRSSGPACILTPQPPPRSSQALNSVMTMAHNTLMAPMSQANTGSTSISAPASRESSPSLKHASSSSSQDSKSNSSSPQQPSSIRSSSSDQVSSPRLSNKDIRERFLESRPLGAVASPEPPVQRSEWQRRSWSERPSPLAGHINGTSVATLDRHPRDKSDTFSDPGILGTSTLGRSSARRSLLSRATTPPPKPPPPKGLHADVYNTVFALQSLGDGWSDYLTRVRSLLDNSMTNTDSDTKGTESPGSELSESTISADSQSVGALSTASSMSNEPKSESGSKESTSMSSGGAGAGGGLGSRDTPQEVEFIMKDTSEFNSSNGSENNIMTTSQQLNTSPSMTGSQHNMTASYNSMMASQHSFGSNSMTGSQYGFSANQNLTSTLPPTSPSLTSSSQHSPPSPHHGTTTAPHVMTSSMYSLNTQQPSPTHRRTPSSPTGSMHSLNEGSGGGTLRRGNKKPAPLPPERPLGPAPAPPDKTSPMVNSMYNDTPEVTLTASSPDFRTEKPPIPERPQVPPPTPPMDKPSLPEKPAFHAERPKVPPPERPPVPPPDKPEKPSPPHKPESKPELDAKPDHAKPDIVTSIKSDKPDVLTKPDIARQEVPIKPDVIALKPDVTKDTKDVKPETKSRSDSKSDGANIIRSKPEKIDKPERPEIPPQPFQRTSSGRPARPGPPPPPPPAERRASQDQRAPLAQAEDPVDDETPNSTTELTRL